MASEIVSIGNQTGEGWFLTGEMLELIHGGAANIVCTQPFACLPNHVVGKGVIKELRRRYPTSNVVAIDFDPGASEVNQLNRIKLMLSTANKNSGTSALIKNTTYASGFQSSGNFWTYFLSLRIIITGIEKSIIENIVRLPEASNKCPARKSSPIAR